MYTHDNTLFRRSDGNFTVVAERRKNRKNYRIRAWFKGDSRTEETTTSEEEAVEAARNIWSQYDEGLFDNLQDKPETVGDLITAALDRTDIRVTTIASYRWVLNLMSSSIGANMPLEEVRKRHIAQWLDGIDCKDISKASYLRTAKAVFSWAVTQKWIRANPCTGLKYCQKHVQRPWLEEADWQAFLNACQPAFRIRAAFVLETGLRKGELINAQWSWVTTANGRTCLAVQPDPGTGFTPKSGRPRMIPLSQTATDLLKEAGERWGNTGYIFFKEKTTSPNLCRETHRACRKAGIREVDFHGLRRSAGSRWLANGIAIQDVSALLGHKDISTTMKHYAGVADAHLAACMDIIDRRVAGTITTNPVNPGTSTEERIPA